MEKKNGQVIICLADIIKPCHALEMGLCQKHGLSCPHYRVDRVCMALQSCDRKYYFKPLRIRGSARGILDE